MARSLVPRFPARKRRTYRSRGVEDEQSNYEKKVLFATMEASKAQKTKAIFFDCDNTLVDTEVSAAEVCAGVVNKVLQDKKLNLECTVEDLLIEFWGLTARQMIARLQGMLNFTLTPEELKQYVLFEEDLVIQHIRANPSPCKGVQEIIQQLHSDGKYQLAVVSSSPIRRIRAALEAADIAKFFDKDHVFSAKNSMPTPKSKPDPAIYQWAMSEMKLQPEQVVTFEDSRSGAQSALRAGIKTVAYVGAYRVKDQREDVADILKKEGCKLVMDDWSQFFDCLAQVLED